MTRFDSELSSSARPPYGSATATSMCEWYDVSVTRFRLFRALMRKLSIWRLVSVDVFSHICFWRSDGYGRCAFATNLHSLCKPRVSTAGFLKKKRRSPLMQNVDDSLLEYRPVLVSRLVWLSTFVDLRTRDGNDCRNDRYSISMWEGKEAVVNGVRGAEHDGFFRVENEASREEVRGIRLSAYVQDQYHGGPLSPKVVRLCPGF